MYPEYNKVKAFMEDARLLEKTSMTMKDIYDLIVKRNLKQTYAEYFNEKGRIKSYKYKQFNKNVHFVAKNIDRMMKKQDKGSPIILKLANSPKWGEVFYAILMAGYKPLLMDARTQKEGTANLAQQAKAVAIISDDLYEYDIKKISSEELYYNHNMFNFKSETFAQNLWEDEVIFCSSGTTGDVKLMIYNGKNICHQIMASLEMPENTKDIMYPGKIKILAMIPMHHIFGFVAVFLWYTFYGKTLVFPNSVSSKDLLKACQKCDVTHVYSVPLLWDSVAQSVQRQIAMMDESYQQMFDHIVKYNIGESQEELGVKETIMLKMLQRKLIGRKVRYCISGGGYLSLQTSQSINGLGYPLYNGFGMTEVGVTSVEQDPDVKIRLLGYIGKPLHGVEYKIAQSDPDVPNVGELLIKSPIVHIREIIGGVERPASLDKEGYFHSGDIAEKFDDNKYMIKGRIKDIIINADGENIFPDELEFCYKNVAHLNNVCVLGVKKSRSQNESIVLVLEVDNSTTDEEFTALKEEIKEISKNLPKGTKIDDVYLAKVKLPLANSMKVKRFAVKKAIESNSPEYVSINTKRKERNFEGYDKEFVDSIREPLRDAFSKILYLPKFKITDNGHWINDLGGDSMSYVELIQFVESHFEVKIPEDLLGQLTCIDDFTEEIIKLKTENKN